jgi:CspA family cold shock protein
MDGGQRSLVGRVSEEGLQMPTGKVLQFDPVRGYGFVAADDGGEDVFIHASVFNGDPAELVPGTPLEFQVMAGDRGRKAFAVRFAEDTPAIPAIPATPATPAIPEQRVIPSQISHTTEEEQMCDVLSRTEFVAELTELLLKTIPALTGPQILELRHNMLDFASKRSWVDL